MAHMQLSLETLKDFNFGKASVPFEKALASAVRDCLDRVGDYDGSGGGVDDQNQADHRAGRRRRRL